MYYTVTENGCKARAMLPVRVMPITACGSLGVSEIIDEEIMVYPNPNGGTFWVRGSMGNTNGDVVIEVYDVLGRVVYSTITRSLNGYIDEQIKLPKQIAHGVYLLTIRVGDEQRSINVVVCR